jgi:predicted amidohydrolase
MTLKVSFIQSNLHWEEVDANLGMFEEKIWSITESTDLIILPEMFSTGFTMNTMLAEPVNGKTVRWMKQMSAQKKAVVMGSYIVREKEQIFNRCYMVRPDGSTHQYDKRHLFSLAGEDKEYTPGADRCVFEINGWRIMPQVCYDLRFPVWSRSRTSEQELYEYDLVIYIASWPKPRISAWDALLKARAIENLAFSIGVNRIGTDGTGSDYVGHSAIYDYAGLALVEPGEAESIQTVTLEKDRMESFRKRFNFQREADSFDFH